MVEWKEKEKKLALSIIDEVSRQFVDEHGVSTFINNVLTEGERITIGRRIAVAQMILVGKTYFEICEKFSISPNTFSNIRKWIHKEMPDYNKVLEHNQELKEKRSLERGRKYREHMQPFGFANLKRRYPGHFLLFNLADEFFSSNQRKRPIRKLK